jgi:hypothetical protein
MPESCGCKWATKCHPRIFSKTKVEKIEKHLNMLYINDIKINTIKYMFQYRCPKIQNQTYTYSKNCFSAIFLPVSL